MYKAQFNQHQVELQPNSLKPNKVETWIQLAPLHTFEYPNSMELSLFLKLYNKRISIP